uniref:Protein E20A n=1 Tax=Elephant endotheliotropic herpesvirus 1A TaxID=759753 RepID=A0A866VUC9_ELHV1|nr:protein E20A [Elephant endotheliotropic herpesvirus 1A]
MILIYNRNYLTLLLLNTCYKLSKEAPLPPREVFSSNRPTHFDDDTALSWRDYFRPQGSLWNNVTDILTARPKICGDIVSKAVCAYLGLKVAIGSRRNFCHGNPL